MKYNREDFFKMRFPLFLSKENFSFPARGGPLCLRGPDKKGAPWV